jgi:hypothetical protein
MNTKIASCFLASWYYYSISPTHSPPKCFLSSTIVGDISYSASYFRIEDPNQLRRCVEFFKDYMDINQ